VSGAPSTPNNMYVQTANQQILVSWDLSVGATSYIIQRSLDNVTFSVLVTLSGSPLATQYIDTTGVLNTQYFYKVAASNILGTSPYTSPQSVVPVAAGEMSLGRVRQLSQEKADRVNSNFVTLPEWNSFINLAMYELYDLLITVYEDYYIGTPVQFTADGLTFLYPLPNGSNTFVNSLNQTSFTPPAFYKLIGVDLALNSASNAFVTVNKFQFSERNRFVYPNTASTIYGVFNLQYRVMGKNIEFIPTPSGNQIIRLWYIPRLTELLADTDPTETSISGWIQYVITRAAKYALDKEESDTTKLDQELMFLKARIEETAANRDAGMPDKISEVRQSSNGGDWNGGNNGPIGGF